MLLFITNSTKSGNGYGGRVLEIERHWYIQSEVRKHKSVNVSSLSTRLSVAENTIRRDLRKLEKEGLVIRVHGGAIQGTNSRGPDDLPFSEKTARFAEEKRRIGIYASSLIERGEIVILDAGTTTIEIARALATRNDITVITNAIDIALTLEESNGDRMVVVTGGAFRKTSRSLLGLPGEEFVSKIHADKVFLSAGGVTIEEGVQNPNTLEVPFKRAIIKAARQAFLVVTKDKIGRKSFTPFAPLKVLHQIITDKGASHSYVERIRSEGVQVIEV
jgi:DeoR/GlpR family transcriptional regulator of sugar metabolism